MTGKALFRSLFFFLYTVILISLLLYLRFPGEKVTALLENTISEKVLHSCTIKGVEHSFPFSFAIAEIRFGSSTRTQTESLSLTDLYLENTTLFPVPSWEVKGNISQNSFNATLQYLPNKKEVSVNNFEMKSVDLDQIPILQNTFRRDVKGILDYKGSFLFSLNDHQTYMGTGSVDIKNFRFQLIQPVLSMQELFFNTFSTDIILKEGIIQVRNGRGQGEQVQTDFTGIVERSSSLLNRNIDIKGKLMFTPTISRFERSIQTDIPFRVTGTTQEPTIIF